jgi:hypothetical protein
MISQKRSEAGLPHAGILVRLHPNHLKALDGWIAKQSAPLTRPQAMRAMMAAEIKTPHHFKLPQKIEKHSQDEKTGLHARARPASKSGRKLRAQELATKTIEKIIDPAAPPEERAQRRRHLTKGPSEFREDRVDLPKSKR